MKLVIRGFVVLLPLLVVGMFAEKLFVTLRGIVHPMLDALPGTVLRGPGLRFFAVLLAAVLLLYVIGRLAETGFGQAFGRRLEARVLSRLPFYVLLRHVASGLAGHDDERALKPVEVEVNPGIRQWGFVVERHSDGCCTVFLPSSPATGSGSVYCVDSSLVRELAIPGHRVLKCLGAWGYGSVAMKDAAKAKAMSAGRDTPVPAREGQSAV